MPEFDPTSNGHRLVKSSTESPGRGGGGVVLVAIVSAATGLSLLAGATVGAFIATVLGMKGRAFISPTAVSSGLAGGVGVWAGVRIAKRISRRSWAGRGFVWPTVGGIVGLAAAVAIASRGLGPLAPIVVILLPGLGALLVDTAADRRATGRRTSNTHRTVPEGLKVPPPE